MMLLNEDVVKEPSKKRTVRLIITDELVEKVWAAVKALSDMKMEIAGVPEGSAWVGIEEIGDFLRRRQIGAYHSKFDDTDPNTRYALKPDVVHKKEWDDHTIVAALVTACGKGIVQNLRKDGVNYFTFVPASAHDLWKLPNTETPVLASWNKELL